MRGLAEWHYGGGPEYCRTCVENEMPCAQGLKGLNGKLCPYREHASTSDEGANFWKLTLACSGQLRTVGLGGVLGFDLHAFLAGAPAFDLETDVIMALLPQAEAGMCEGVAALKEREEDKEGDG